MGNKVEEAKQVVEKESTETSLPTSDTIQVITLHKVSNLFFFEFQTLGPDERLLALSLLAPY